MATEATLMKCILTFSLLIICVFVFFLVGGLTERRSGTGQGEARKLALGMIISIFLVEIALIWKA